MLMLDYIASSIVFLVVQLHGCNQVIHGYAEVHPFHNGPYEMVELLLVGSQLYSLILMLCAHAMDNNSVFLFSDHVF